MARKALAWMMASAVGVGLSAWAVPARADFCASLANGMWCDGDSLRYCQGGQIASSQTCPCGCQSMPAGTDDQCKSCSSDFCSGKANGLWCDGAVLKTCSGGTTTGSQSCSCGCQSMPAGTDDQCQSCSSDFCSGKANGLWCDGAVLKTCSGGATTGSQSCSCGCQSMPSGTDDQCQSCSTDFCGAKANGLWCDGAMLKTCSGGATTGTQSCSCGCQSMPAGTDDQCQSCTNPTGFCAGKDDGAWCNSGSLTMCAGGVESSTTSCPNGCVTKPEGTPDECAAETSTGFCTGKDDGSHCNGSALAECVGGQQVSVKDCTGGCVQMPSGMPDVCGSGSSDFCSDKADGYWCNAALLAKCSGGVQVSGLNCPDGCQSMPAGQDDHCIQSSPEVPAGQGISVTDSSGCGALSGSINLWQATSLPVFNQRAYNDTLGTCDLTIAEAGCMITSFAMLYNYLGLTRTVNGDSGMDPAIENAWRTQNGGYADGCLAYHNVNPSGLVVQQHYNPKAECVAFDEAAVIATSLNSGMPVIAGVHWNACSNSDCENAHWVLIIGADSNGFIINDPWNGKGSVHFDVHDPPYVLDMFLTPALVGSGSGADSGGAVDESGNPVGDDAAHTGLPTAPGSLATAAGPTSEESACSAGPAPRSLGWKVGWLLAALAGWQWQRRRIRRRRA